jgi:hypothetical protein
MSQLLIEKMDGIWTPLRAAIINGCLSKNKIDRLNGRDSN